MNNYDTISEFLKYIKMHLNKNGKKGGNITMPYGHYKRLMDNIYQYISFIFENQHNNRQLLSEDIKNREYDMRGFKESMGSFVNNKFKPKDANESVEEIDDDRKNAMFSSLTSWFDNETPPVKSVNDDMEPEEEPELDEEPQEERQLLLKSEELV